MATGLPPIVVNDPAYIDIVKHGHNGLIAKRGIKGFAQAISNALDDPKLIKKMSGNALETAQEYSLQESVSRLEELYSQLITKGQPSQKTSQK